jgi:uncharacterized protein (DUF1778 family)
MKISTNIYNLKHINHELEKDQLKRKLAHNKNNRLSTQLSPHENKKSLLDLQSISKQVLSTSNIDQFTESVTKDADELGLKGSDRENYISTGVNLKQKENPALGLLFDIAAPDSDQYDNFNKMVSDLEGSEQSHFLSAANHADHNVNQLVQQTSSLEGTERSQFLSAADLAGDSVGSFIQMTDKLSGTERTDFLAQAASQNSKEDLVSLIQSKNSELVQKNIVKNGATIGNIKISDIEYSENDDGTITATGKADLSAYGLGSSVDVDLDVDKNYKISGASTQNSLEYNIGGEVLNNKVSGGVSIQGTVNINHKGLSIDGNASFDAFGQQLTISEGNFSITKNANNTTNVSFNGGMLSGMGVNTTVSGSIISDGTLQGTSLMLSTSASIATDMIPGFDKLEESLNKLGLDVNTTLSSASIIFNPGQDTFSIKTDGFTFDMSKSDDGTKTIDIKKILNGNDGTSTTFTASMIDGNYYDENAQKTVNGQYFEANLTSGLDTSFIPGFDDMKSALSGLGINLDTDMTDAFVSFDLERDVFSLSYNGMRFESYTNAKDERVVSFGGFSFGSGVSMELSDVTYNAETNAISATVKGGIGFGVGEYGIGIDLAQADFSYDPKSGEFSLTQRQTVAGFGVTTSLTLDLSDIMEGKITVKNASVTPEVNTQLANNIASGLENALKAGGDVAEDFKNTLDDLGSKAKEDFAKAAAKADDSIKDLVSYTKNISDDIKDDFLEAASKAGDDLDNLIDNAKKLSGNSLKNFVKKAASSDDLKQFLNKFGSIYNKLNDLSSKFSNIEVNSNGTIKANFQVPGAASTTLTFDENSNGELTASGSLTIGGHKFSNASFTFDKSGSLKNVSGGISLKVWGVGTSASLEIANGNVRAKGSFHYGFGSISFSLDKSGLHIS